MLATLAFWALLWLPGLAVVQRWAKAEVQRGLLSAVALGYAASFALLSPFSWLCYGLSLPSWVFSAAVAASVVLGAIALWRAHAGKELADCFAADLGLPLLLVGLLLAMDVRVGGWLDGDATYHVGRIRNLLDHGFNNRDIYLAEPYFAYAYHTNLLHGLYAAATQLGSGDPLMTWFASLPWARLVIAAGHYHLAHVLFRSRFAAWLAALVVSAARASETYSIYPNLVAVGWLAPMLLAACFAAHERDADRKRSLFGIALCGVLCAQVHALYWALAGVALAPMFGARVIADVRGPRRSAGFFTLCLLALVAGAPFALIARYGGQPSPEQVRRAQAAVTLPFELPAVAAPSPSKPSKARAGRDYGGGHLEKKLEHRSDGTLALPGRSAGGPAFLLLGFGALALCLLWPERLRPRMVALTCAAATLAAIPLLPPLCTFVARHVLPDFGVARMTTLASSLLLVALSGAIASIVDRVTAPTAWRSVVIGLVTAAASQLPGHGPRSWSEHVANVLGSEPERHAMLDQHRARRDLLRAHVPSGETVLAPLREGRYVVMLDDLYLVATDRTHGHVPLLGERRQHVELMTQVHTPWSIRERLLRHYGLRFVIYRDKFQKRFTWAHDHGHELGQAGGLHLVRLEGPP